MHPGWAAQSGLRAALLARAGFTGPRTVFEGVHGLFHGFAHTREGDYARAARRLRRALADADAGLQALPLRHHDPALHRLRAAPACARHRAGRDCRDGLRGRRGHGAPPVGAAGREAAPAQRLRRQVRHALLHRRRLHRTAASASTPSPTRPLPIRPCARSPPRCATEIDPANPYPQRLHRPHPRHACATAASSRSASRTCAAGPASR